MGAESARETQESHWVVRVGVALAITVALLGAVSAATAYATNKPNYNCTLSERASLGFHDVDDMHDACNNLPRPPLTADVGHERGSK